MIRRLKMVIKCVISDRKTENGGSCALERELVTPPALRNRSRFGFARRKLDLRPIRIRMTAEDNDQSRSGKGQK